jgi:hypothetical protein
MSLKIQETPQAPSYAAANIQVRANIATPQATMEAVNAQQGQLNSVNNLSGGRRRRTQRRKQSRQYKQHKSFIRTYKGRKYVSSQEQEQQQQQQQKGGSGAIPAGQIPVPQVGTTCTSGPQCAGAQNANFTALYNQAQSNSINDAYAQSGGSGKHYHKKVRFSHTKHHRKTKQRHNHSLTSTIAYNIKKVFRKVFN